MSNGVDGNGHDHHQEEEEEDDVSSSKTTDSSNKPPSSGQQKRRSGDVRTWCDVCSSEGANSSLVRCDECRRCFHFWCTASRSPPPWGFS